MKLKLSPLGHTWFLDLDGTIVQHNGHKTHGKDILLPETEHFFKELPPEDKVVFTTSRTLEEKEQTEAFLKEHKIPFHDIVYGLPFGERILINDKKPSGLITAYALNTQRDDFPLIEVEVDHNL